MPRPRQPSLSHESEGFNGAEPDTPDEVSDDEPVPELLSDESDDELAVAPGVVHKVESVREVGNKCISWAELLMNWMLLVWLME